MIGSRFAVFAVTLLVFAGCNSKPQAPALRDEPVYHSDKEGLRFLVPEGWSLHAKSDAQPGKLERERLLVQYQRFTSDKGATFEVTLADLPESTDLGAHLTGPSYGVKKWEPTGKPEKIEIRGVPATRYIFRGKVGGSVDMTKETVVFRRGGRVYFFHGLFGPTDAKARDQVRRAVESTIWKS